MRTNVCVQTLAYVCLCTFDMYTLYPCVFLRTNSCIPTLGRRILYLPLHSFAAVLLCMLNFIHTLIKDAEPWKFLAALAPAPAPRKHFGSGSGSGQNVPAPAPAQHILSINPLKSNKFDLLQKNPVT